MFKRLLTTALVFGMASLAPPAWAMTCAPRDGIVERLSDTHSETLTSRGLQNESTLIEIFTSPKTGSYTILMSRADGISCIVSSGTHWLNQTPVAAPEGVTG